MARPREFDHEKVMNQVTKLFWEKGFKGTSMDNITTVTGLNKGSLYSCFGNKEKLFSLALQHYLSQGAAALPKKESAVATLCQYYSFIIREADRPKKERRGCFVFNSCQEFGSQEGPLSSFVLSIGHKRECFFRDLIYKAIADGEISKKINAESAANRAFATAFTIREMSKFKPDQNFLCDLANSYLQSIGVQERVNL